MVRRSDGVARGRLVAPLAAGLGLAVALTVAPAHVAGAMQTDDSRLYLVTFEGPGTAGYAGPLSAAGYRIVLSVRQDAALDAVGGPVPVYRWTTALSGLAVDLTPGQASSLRRQPGVDAVQENEVRRLTATTTAPTPPTAPTAPAALPGRGGRGVVVGVVDTGVSPDGAVFAELPGLGPAPRPRDFSGACQPGEDWSPRTCNAKLVAASWFVAGYGEQAIAADEPLSARDVRGHGTALASIAVGNAQVDVDLPGLRTSFGGVAPRARLAAYKACWSAPDPDDDGCATADLVAAIDRATADGVDVLNLGVGGAAGVDPVDRALLGAAEAGVVVVASAGNDPDEYAAHDSPWVTTVGGLRQSARTGVVVVGDTAVAGAMTSHRTVRARIVRSRDVPAPGVDRAAAAVCRPGALDAAAVADRVVLCVRGAIGRIEKSTAVARAGGVGMVLVNHGPGPVAQDLHAVPTVHLGHDAARGLRHALAERTPLVTLRPDPSSRSPKLRVAGWSSAGDPAGSFVKPDLVAPATGLLAATPPTSAGQRWSLASGTSAATAWTSGAAAVLLSRFDWPAAAVRSALASTASPVPGSVLRSGAGTPRLDRALRTRLVHDVPAGAYRAWLVGARPDVNTTSLLAHGTSTLTRRVTNLGDRTGTWQAAVTGIERYAVSVSPSSITLAPGESATYRVSVGDGSLVGGLDDGYVVWNGDLGDVVRVPLAITR